MITSTDIKNLDGTQSDVTVAEFVAAAKNKTSNPLGFIKVIAGGNTLPNLTHDNMQSFTVNKSVCTSSQFTVGSMVAGELDITLLTETVVNWGAYTSLSSFWFEPYVGYTCVHNNEEADAYIKLGTFSIDTSQTKKNGLFTTLVAYDNLYSKVLEGTLPSAFSFNMDTNPKANMDALLSATSLTSSFDTTNLPSTGETYVNITSDMTIKEAIGRIAIAGGRNCMTDRAGKIAFYYPTIKSAADVSIDGSHFNSIDIDDSDATTVGYVTAEYDRESDSEKSATYPSTQTYSATDVGLTFDNTYFPWVPNDTYNRQEPLYELYSRLLGGSGYTYQGHTLTSPSLCFIDPFDRVDVDASAVYKLGTSSFVLRPMTIKTTYNGAIMTEISASTIDNQNDTNNSVSVKIESAGKVITENLTNLATAHYGTCSTAGNVATKDVSLSTFKSLYEGATVSVKFTNANDWSLLAGQEVKLRVNNIEPAALIQADGANLSQASMYDWSAGQIVDFLYDGEYWNITGINVTRFMSFDSNGLHLAQNSDGTGFNVTIGSNDLSFNNGGTKLMEFAGTKIYIGSKSTDRVVIDNNGMYIYEGSSTVPAMSLEEDSLIANDIKTRYVYFNNDPTSSSSTDTTLVWEKRENGHLSLKIGSIGSGGSGGSEIDEDYTEDEQEL